MSGKLTILIGVARSGKSTYAQKWLHDTSAFLEYGESRVIVNADKIRLAHHGQRYLKSAEPFIHAVTHLMVKTHFASDYHVLVDETSTTVSSLRRWLEIDPDATFVFLNTPIEICIQRAYNTGQADLAEKGVISRQFKNLEQLVRDYHPDIAVREDGTRDVLTRENLLESIENIRQEVKGAML